MGFFRHLLQLSQLVDFAQPTTPHPSAKLVPTFKKMFDLPVFAINDASATA